jgi:hypothetical protein
MNAEFDGSLNDFRALMLHLQNGHGGSEWNLPSGGRLRVEEGPSFDPTIHLSWVISIPIDVDGSNRRHATIQAFRRGERSIVLLEDGQRIASSGASEILGRDRAIGPLFDELCQELRREMNRWYSSARGSAPTPQADDGLDPLDRKIITVVRRIEDEGLRATDELVASRLSLNPKTNQSYHRITISRRRNRMRDNGINV